MKIFGHDFFNLDEPFIQQLQTLEREGAIYEQFWQDAFCDFRFCRIILTPKEVFDYVNACIAYDDFLKNEKIYGNLEKALQNISNKKISSKVEEYNEWSQENNFNQEYCFAAFLGEHLEDLLCGGLPERYEFLSQTYAINRKFLLLEILERFSTCAKFLEQRQGNRPLYKLDEEQDVRDLLYVIIKSVFSDARIEEHTQIHASGSKIIDIVIPKISTLIEIKFVRNSEHAKKVANELKIDIESYHTHPNCKNLYCFIWDAGRYLKDKENFVNDLRGFRKKDKSEFNVEVMIKP